MKLTPINPHFNACDQKWELMPEQDGGRHCGACERVLVDFTPLTEQQMLNKHRESDTKLCGRYTRGQVDRLHRHLALEESNSKPWLVSLAMGVGAMLPFSLAAQQPSNEVLIGDTIIMPPTAIEIPINKTVPLPGSPGQMQYPLLDAKPVPAYFTVVVVDDYNHKFITDVTISGYKTEADSNGTIRVFPESEQDSFPIIINKEGYYQQSGFVKAGETIIVQLERESNNLMILGRISPDAFTKPKPKPFMRLKNWVKRQKSSYWR